MPGGAAPPAARWPALARRQWYVDAGWADLKTLHSLIHAVLFEQVRLARRLSLEWQAYVVRTHALRKVFVTVKGFNYQVCIDALAHSTKQRH